MRHIPNSMAAALDESQIRPAFLVELEFSGQYAHLWSGRGALHWKGRIFNNGVTPASGVIGTISSVGESGELAAHSITYGLSGIPSDTEAGRDLIELADKYTNQGGTARLWFATLDENYQLDGEPWPLAETLIDVPTITLGADSVAIAFSTETRLSRQQNRQGRRYTHEDQQLDYPGDLGFEFVNELQDKTL